MMFEIGAEISCEEKKLFWLSFRCIPGADPELNTRFDVDKVVDLVNK